MSAAGIGKVRRLGHKPGEARSALRPIGRDVVELAVADDRVVQHLVLLVRHPPPTNCAGLAARAVCANPVNVRVNVLACAYWGAAADQRKKAPVHARSIGGTRSGRRWCSVLVPATITDRFETTCRSSMRAHTFPAIASTSSPGSSIRAPSSAKMSRAWARSRSRNSRRLSVARWLVRMPGSKTFRGAHIATHRLQRIGETAWSAMLGSIILSFTSGTRAG